MPFTLLPPHKSLRTMITRIARKECTEMIRDGRFRWAAGIVFVLLAGSLLVGWKHYADVEAQRAESQAADRETWVSQGEKSQHSAAHFGSYAFKPTSPLSSVDRGVLPYTGVSVFMEAHRVKEAGYRPVEDANAMHRLGALTAASTLQLLIPLLIILLAFSAFAGEREQGTLRQLMSLGLQRRTVALGKALGVVLPLMLLLAPAAVVGAVAMALYAGPDAALWSLPRLLLMITLYLLYFGLFIGLALIVSARASSARVALIVLLGFWLWSSFLVPRIATDAADALFPTPTSVEFDRAVQADYDQLPAWTDRTRAVEERLMQEHGVETPDQIPVSVAGYTLLEAEEDETRVYRKHFDALGDTYLAQNRVVQAGAVLAPMTAVQAASMGLAGSDYAHHRHFVDAAEAYRFDFVQTLNRDMVTQNASWDYRAGRAMWESIPAFIYESPGLGWTLGHYTMGLGLLGLWFVAVALMVPVAVTRMKIN